MDGIHDLGGMDNLGPVVREENEPVFHEDWERIVFANSVAILGARYMNLDEVRRATEWMPPAEYLSAAYYETWLFSLTSLLLEKGLVTEKELQEGHSLDKNFSPPAPALPKQMAVYALNNPIPTCLDLDIPSRFSAGERVIAKNIHPVHHIRMPRYVRGKPGVIQRDHGVFLLPDTSAHGGPETPQHCYSVRFDGAELWGEDDRSRNTAVYIDLFEEYLESV